MIPFHRSEVIHSLLLKVLKNMIGMSDFSVAKDFKNRIGSDHPRFLTT